MKIKPESEISSHITLTSVISVSMLDIFIVYIRVGNPWSGVGCKTL